MWLDEGGEEVGKVHSGDGAAEVRATANEVEDNVSRADGVLEDREET
ncbi:uncharacterized protein J3R85_019411 [Psidium guajava]|nr:uncharacterized protein J3R85_019411 [Psidium guajava]